MTSAELDQQLIRIRDAWPAESSVEAVLTRIDADRIEPVPSRPGRPRAVWLAVAAALLLAVVSPAFVLLTTPRTLQAQVEQTLRQAGTALIKITAMNEQGVRTTADIWYSRGLGIRCESPDEVLIDNGREQWAWRPTAAARDLIVSRRPSRDASSMISGMFQMQNAPADWSKNPAPEHDRRINSRACRGFVVVPGNQMAPAESGSALVPEPNPTRFIILVDPDERIVHVAQQRKVNGEWLAGREIAIEYGVEIGAEKFAASFPAGAQVVNADQVLEQRFPVALALSRVESGGLSFAVHELDRVEGDAFYIVSSVRGTPEHLRKFPPVAHRLNLQTTILDVAEQLASPGITGPTHRLILAATELDGVHYVWWIASQRHYFQLEEGKRKAVSDTPSIETSPGHIRVPLMARYRDPRAGFEWINTVAEVALPADSRVHTLADIAARARRDALLITQQGAAHVRLIGDVKNTTHIFAPDQISDADFAKELIGQREWMWSYDQVTLPDAGAGLPGSKANDGK